MLRLINAYVTIRILYVLKAIFHYTYVLVTNWYLMMLLVIQVLYACKSTGPLCYSSSMLNGVIHLMGIEMAVSVPKCGKAMVVLANSFSTNYITKCLDAANCVSNLVSVYLVNYIVTISVTQLFIYWQLLGSDWCNFLK